MFTTRKMFFGPLIVILIFLESCVGSRLGSATKGEELKMTISERKDVVNFNALKEQPTASLATRGNKSRGLISPVVGSVVSIASDAIKKVIANEQKKYVATYPFALTDLYFYDQMSDESPFDPVGMQFAGFKIKRTFINKDGHTDTAFTASFSLDTSNAYEIFNNSMFRLRLDDFTLRYAKAKIAEDDGNELNMDIEITFRSSYVNQDGVLFDNVILGKFYLFIRVAPLDVAAPNHDAYYNALKGKLLSGKSFLVPRSFGYHMEDGQPKPGYSQGAYTIDVQIKESSKDHFISKIISENAGLLIDAYKEKTIEVIKNKLPGN